MSPKDYLGGLTAIKYSNIDNKWIEADIENIGNDWYNYVAQTGITDGKTSNWANAKTNDSNAYFVWIPRYAYKITYFDTVDNANLYRNNNDSTEGIIGYSNINGIVKVENSVEKLLKDSKPINVTSTVQSSEYADYIPHPAFEFGEETNGTKARNMDRKI